MPIIGTVASSYEVPKSVVTGGTLTSDATYYYRTFTGNGTLIVSASALTCDVLIGAGGGGINGYGTGSGGGSYTSNYSAIPGSYNFVVGAIGNDSTGIGVTAYAGAPAQEGYGNGNSGGSGSGAGNSEGGAGSGGAATKASGGTILYGNAGGSNSSPAGYGGSGGGGGWGGGGGQPYKLGPFGDQIGFGGNAGSGTTAYNSWSQATGIGQLSGGVYYIGAGRAGNSQSAGNAALGLGANSSGYEGSGFVMVRYLKTAV